MESVVQASHPKLDEGLHIYEFFASFISYNNGSHLLVVFMVLKFMYLVVCPTTLNLILVTPA